MTTWRQRLRASLPLALRRFGQRAGSYLSDWMYLDALRRWGFQPSLIIDVGAYQGDWTRFAAHQFPDCTFLMIEAQESKRSQLEGLARKLRRSQVEVALLGAVDGASATFVEAESGSSVYPEVGDTIHPPAQRRQRSLDAVLESHGMDRKRINLMKLDVQGYELEVLKGASAAIERTEIIVAEASLIPVNQGCPLFHEVISFMAERHFDVFDLGAQIRLHDGALWQTDIVFARRGSPLWSRPAA